MRVVDQILYNTTYECNLRCRYCYLANARQKTRLTNWDYVKNSARKLVDKFKAEDFLLRDVIYHGAETTTVPAKILAETCNIFHEIAPEEHLQSVQTNGTLVTPEYIAQMEDVLDDDIYLSFSVSVDGPRVITDKYRNRGTYEKAMQNILYLHGRGYRVGMLGCLSAHALDHLPALEQWIRTITNLGLLWKFQLASGEYGLTNEQQVYLAHWIHERGWINKYNCIQASVCATKGNECVIYHFNANGLSIPCEKSLGKTPVSWLDKKIEIVLDSRVGAFRGTPTSKECDYCPVKPICNSGCPATRVKGEKAYDCAFRKTLYQLESRRLNVPMNKIIRLYSQRIKGKSSEYVKMVGEIRNKK